MAAIWENLTPSARKEIRSLARRTLKNITIERLAAKFSEAEFELLERGADGQPIDLAEFGRVHRKFVDTLTAQGNAMMAFFNRLQDLGCPPDAPIGAFCDAHGITIPEGIPDIVRRRKAPRSQSRPTASFG
jgi:hypothetical protein